MGLTHALSDGLVLTSLKRIGHPKGDVYHVLKSSESSFEKFGEAYFTTVNQGDVKGWKKHNEMVLNLVVPCGQVEFYLIKGEMKEALSITLGENNYSRLTVPAGWWVAFRGEFLYNLVLNIASIEHDPNEAINVPIETFPIGGGS